MSEKEPLILVVGGVNCDVSGTPSGPLRLGDSNPGRITLTPGGVGRNIAENLARLGHRVSMITALGTDARGDFIRNSCRELGIDLSLSFTFPDERTSTYLCLNDEHGDVLGAVSDMAICDRLTPDVVAQRLPQLQSADLIVLDANLSPATIDFVAQNTSCPIFADPVSVAKAGRLASSLGRFTMIKPNAAEAALLSGVTIENDNDLTLAAWMFLRKGLKQVIISLGGRGIFWHDGTSCGIQPCLPMPVRNTNGCGDAFLAAAASACLQGMSLRETVCYGLAASAVCAQSDSAVNPDLSHQLLLDCIKRYSENT